ncbi:epoxide hydrolase [Phlyctema vagabunda]|uniref:Epoxide hydrolase n=1 Tax=Phlyctema vagabunda TaxID=108571 RepID=A0ABR4PIA8_9HELO
MYERREADRISDNQPKMMDSSIASLSAAGEEIKPYKIHVSSKYLELTQKKLELTRLPHELLLPKAREWELGTPKSEIEPLIDYWLEQYSWRDREAHLNSTLPQFRTAIQPTPGGVPLRIHFIHVRSPHAHAIPLLLIPPFPLTNISLAALIKPLAEPESPTSTQPFHVVIPSMPGLGFSDAFSGYSDGKQTVLAQTAEIFNSLMVRLGYGTYIASATGGGRESPVGIDYHLACLIGEAWSENCQGVHVINPLVERPRLRREPLGWIKLSFASFFQARIFGYEAEDFAALRESHKMSQARKATKHINERTPMPKSSMGNICGAAGMLGLREPNTLAYALCDSPAGLMSWVCSALRRASPNHHLSETDIIDVTQMTWLPGPEACMRLWASAVSEVEELRTKKHRRSKLAITVFGCHGDDGYVCPAWVASKHDVVFVQRPGGRAGLLAWDNKEVIISGIQGLARELEKTRGRIKVAPLEQVVVDRSDETIFEEGEPDSESDYHFDGEIPDTTSAGPR